MSNQSPVSGGRVGNGGGGGIACLRRQFEMQNDSASPPPQTTTVSRPRPTSLFEKKTAMFKQSEMPESNNRPSPVRPKPKRNFAMSDSTVALNGTASPLTPTLPTVPKKNRNGTAEVEKGTPVSEPTSKEGQHNGDEHQRSNGESNDSVVSTISDSSCSQIEVFDDQTATPRTDQEDDVFSPYRTVSNSGVAMEKSDSVDVADGKDDIRDSSVTEEKTEGSISMGTIMENIESTSPVTSNASECAPAELSKDSPSNTGVQQPKTTIGARRSVDETNTIPRPSILRVRQVARSTSNLLGSPSAPSTNKDHNDLSNKDMKTVPSAVVSQKSQSASAADDIKHPTTGKKGRPPPPVPRKTAKSVDICKSAPVLDAGTVSTPNGAISASEGAVSVPSGTMSVSEEAVSIPSGAVSVTEGAVSVPSGAVSVPEGPISASDEVESISGESQTLLNPSAEKKLPRPNCIFPQTTTKALDSTDENMYNSLPNILDISHTTNDDVVYLKSPKRGKTDTLFPSCNRERSRPQMFKSEDNLISPDKDDVSPMTHHRSCTDLLDPVPSSQGLPVPSDTGSLNDNGQEMEPDSQSHTKNSNCELDDDTSKEQDRVPQLSSETLETEQEVSQDTKSETVFDAGDFVSSAFDFLDESPGNDPSRASYLRSWTEIWSSTQNLHQDSVAKGKVQRLRSGEVKTTAHLNKTEPGEISNTDTVRRNRSSMNRLSTGGRNGLVGGNVESSMEKKEMSSNRLSFAKKSDENKDLNRNRASVPAGNVPNVPKSDVKYDVTDDVKPTAFGSVLRRKGSTLSQSSSSSSDNSLKRDRRPESLVSQVSATGDSTSRTNTTTKDIILDGKTAQKLTRTLPSTISSASSFRSLSSVPSLPLTILPSQKPARNIPGKYVGGKPSVFLGEMFASTTVEPEKTDLEKDIDAIDSAFEFLDNSGA